METFDRLLELPNVSRISLHKEVERLFYKKIINNSGLQNCYSNSWAYIWQIANENSFKYYDGFALLSLTPVWGQSFPDELTINSEQTIGAAKTAVNFAKKAAAVFNRPIFLRKIYNGETKNYLAAQKKLMKVPKFQKNSNICFLPDDNFPERIIDIPDQIECIGRRYQYFRRKRNRFLRSADTSLLEIRENYTTEDYFNLLEHWSQDISLRLCKQYPSMKYDDILTWVKSPYPSLHAFFNSYRDEEDIFSYMVYYDGEPAGLLCACRMSTACAALYGNYALTSLDCFPYYHALMVSKYLKEKGFSHVNHGGSEIAGLDFFKRKCGGFQKVCPESFVVEP